MLYCFLLFACFFCAIKWGHVFVAVTIFTSDVGHVFCLSFFIAPTKAASQKKTVVE